LELRELDAVRRFATRTAANDWRFGCGLAGAKEERPISDDHRWQKDEVAPNASLPGARPLSVIAWMGLDVTIRGGQKPQLNRQV
jgi:hypothetical protein